MMTKIPTGFTIKPLVGSIAPEQLLTRYFPKERFRQMLENSGLWFTRTYKWRDMDACEANLLPSYRKYLRSEHADKSEFLHIKAMMEFNLIADLGCCFSICESGESDVMWRAYTPGPDYGVAVITRASEIASSIFKPRPNIRRAFLAKVKYLSETKANEMNVSNAIHSRTKRGDMHWDLAECHYFKKDAYSAEREVRAVLSSNDSWTDLFEIFVQEHKIELHSLATPLPTDQPYVRADMRSSINIVTPRDCSVFLTVPQMKSLTKFIESDGIKYLESGNGRSTLSPGLYLPCDLNTITQIVMHPALHNNSSEQNYYEKLKREYNLKCALTISQLYSKSW